jgi:hypothetical protein
VTDQGPVLVLISLDPRQSHRANEAMRIGLGIVSGENEVTFVLTGPGVNLLSGDTDDLVDGDDIVKFRASLKALGIPFHVEEASRPSEPDWNADGHPVTLVDTATIVDFVRASRRVLNF